MFNKSIILNNREEAAKRGHKFYLGSRCKRGHDGVRYTASGECVRCSKNQSEIYKRRENGIEYDFRIADEINERRKLKNELAEVWEE